MPLVKRFCSSKDTGSSIPDGCNPYIQCHSSTHGGFDLSAEPWSAAFGPVPWQRGGSQQFCWQQLHVWAQAYLKAAIHMSNSILANMEGLIFLQSLGVPLLVLYLGNKEDRGGSQQFRWQQLHVHPEIESRAHQEAWNTCGWLLLVSIVCGHPFPQFRGSSPGVIAPSLGLLQSQQHVHIP